MTIATALNAADTLDGVTLAAGDRVLVKDQTAPEENGVYIVSASPARAADYAASGDIVGSVIVVSEGTANADTAWKCTTNAPITVDTTALVFAAFGGGASAHDTSHEDGGADEISIAGLAGESVELAAHKADTTAAHAASAVGFTPASGIAATDVQAAIVEDAGDLAAHLADAVAAHAASAIAFTPNGSIAATDVQAAIQEVRDEAGAGGGGGGPSAIAYSSGDVTVTGSLADITGCSVSLTAGTYIVTGVFDVLVNNALNDRVFEGHLDSGGADQTNYGDLVAPGLVNVRAMITQTWRLVLASTTTVKLRAKYSGGTVGDFTVKAQTVIAAWGAGTSVASDGIWDAAGDLAVGTGADTAARLAIGASGTVLQSNGTTAAWAGAFASWTPALTADTTNPTLGAGSSVAGRYAQIGKLVMGYGEINFGTSGVVAGSGVYEVNFPVTSATTIGQKVVGHGYLYDSSAAIFRQVECYQVDSGEFAMVLEGATTVAHNTPWTWAASDILRFQVLYEAA